MKRRAFIQNKLWRDRAVELMEEMGSVIHWQRLSDDEFAKQLHLKLVEEVEEVVCASSREACVEELADVFTVLETLMEHSGITRDEVETAVALKKEKRGGFIGRKYVTIAEHAPNSFGEQYCLADPDKYPEVQGHHAP